MRQIWAYAWKEIYITFRDRNLLLIMLATPLALSIIIGMAFGGVGSTASFENLPVALVNLDEGAMVNGQAMHYGNLLSDILTGTGDTTGQAVCTAEQATPQTVSLDNLLRVVRYDSIESAQASVTNGDSVASVIIPSTFTQSLTAPISNPTEPITPIEIVVSGSGASPISAGIVKSVVEAISNQLLKGNIAIATTIQLLTARAQSDPAFGISFATATLTGTFAPDFSCAFTSAYHSIGINAQPLTLAQEKSAFIQVLIAIGAGQAVYFALFTAQAAFQALFEERRQGTLQRLLITPIPRFYIMVGKVIGTFLTVLLQLSVLMVALTMVASIGEGVAQFIWGQSFFHLAIVVLVLSLSVCGVGVLITGVAKTPQQAQVVSPIIITLFGVLGGIFGFSIPAPISYISPIYWGVNALEKLSNGDLNVGINVLVLLILGMLLFSIGVFFFNKRVDV